jgi:hypothetical protein
MSGTKEVHMGRRRKTQKEEAKPKPGTVLVSLVYFTIIAGVAYFLSRLVLQQVDPYELLGLYGTEIPLIKAPATDVPQWVFHLILGLVFFFLLQPFVVLFTGLFSGGKKEEEEYRRVFRDPGER